MNLFTTNVSLWCEHISLENEILSLSGIYWTFSVVNSLQRENILLEISNCYLSLKLICFMIFGTIEQIRV